MYQKTSILLLRKLVRLLGLTKPIAQFLGRKGYEEKFHLKLTESVKNSDVVWDVGGNLGYYSRIFSGLASAGKVLVFEPDPENFRALKKNVGDLGNVEIQEIALNDKSGTYGFIRGADPIGATSSFAQSSESSTKVVAKTADELAGEDLANRPDLIKIDVEGYELRVLKGMTEILEKGVVREIYLEVHFAKLETIEGPNAVKSIWNLLLSYRYNPSWIDPSHLHAMRGPQL